MATLTIAADTSWSKIYSTSSTAFTIAIGGTAALTVPAGQAYTAGMNLGLYPQGTSLLTPLACNVASYSGTTLTLNVTAFGVLAGGTVGAVNTMADRFAKQALSVTSNTVGVASKTWAIRPGLNLTAGDGTTTGDQLNIVSRVSQANRMFGRVTAYDNTTGSVTINCTTSTGSGTFTDWMFTSGGSVSSWIVDVLDGDTVDVTGFATLTFDVAPWGCPLTYQAIAQGKIKHTNTAEANPIIVRLAGKGTIDVRSNSVWEAKSATYKTIGTGTGAALSLTLSSAWDNLCYPTAVEVETGSGTGVYEQWQVYPSYIYGVNRFGYHYGCDLLDVFQGNLGGTCTGAVASTAYPVTGGTGTGGEFFVTNVSSGDITGGYPTKGVGYSVNDVLTITVGANTKTFTVTVLGTFGATGPLNKVAIWNPNARALLFGDGTNGVAVISGAKVRLPNCALEGLPQEAPLIAALTTASTTATFESGAAITIFDNSQMFIDSEAITSSAKTTNTFTLTRGGTAGRGSLVAAHAAGAIARNHNLGSVTNKCQILTNPGGTIDFDGMILGENITIQSANAKGVTLKRTGSTGQLQIRNTPAAVTIDQHCQAGNPYADCIAGGPIVYLNTVQGIINANNVTIGQATWNTNIGQGNVFFQPLNCPQIASMANFRVAAVKLRRYDINTVFINGCLFLSDGALHDFDVVVRSLFQTLSGTRFYNIRHCAHGAKFLLTSSAVAENGIFAINTSDTIFHGLGSVSGCQPIYMNPLTLDGGSNSNIVHSCAYDGMWLGSPSLFHLYDNRGVNNSFANISSTAIRDSTYYNYSNGGSQYGTTERRNNIRLGSAFVGGSQLPSSESQDDFVVGTSVSSSVPNLQDAAWFHNLIDGGTLTPTTGRIFVGRGGPNVIQSNYTTTGSVRTYTDNSGAFYLGDSGDTLTFSNWYPLRGITSFQNSAITTSHTNWTGVTEDIRFCPWGQDITAVSYVTMTIANVLTMWSAMTGYTSNAGLKIQIRYTATTTLTNRKTDNVYLLTNVNSAFLPPVGYVPLTISAIVAGSSIVTTFVAVQYGLSTSAGTTVVTSLPYGFAGTTETASVTVTKLGYLPFIQGTSFGRRGANMVAVQQADPAVTVSNPATVSAYTALDTVAKLYDYVRYYETTASGIGIAGIASKSGTTINFGAYNLVFDATAASVFSVSGNTITIRFGTLTAGAVVTTGTVTYLNGAVAQVPVTSSAGTTGVLTLTLPSGSSVVIYKQDTTRDQYVASSGTTVTSYIPAGITGSYTFKAISYGKLAANGSVTVTGGGYLSGSLSPATDTGITQATVSTVAAYTTLGNLDALYDYSAYYETTTTGIDYARVVNKVGTAVDLIGKALTISGTGSVWAYNGTTATITAAALADGATFKSLTTTAAVIYTNGSTFQTVITSSAGTTGVFTISGLAAHNVYLQNAVPAQVDYQTGVSTFTNYIPAGTTGTWRWRVAKYGNVPETGTFATAGGGRLSATLNNVADTSIVQPTLATVLAYTTLETCAKLYDYCQAYLTTSAGNALGQIATKAGVNVNLGAYNLIVDATAGTVFALASNITIKAATLTGGTLLTTGTVAATNGALIQITYTAAGVTYNYAVYSVSGYTVGSRVQIYNVSTATEIYNGVPGSGTYSVAYYDGTGFTSGQTVRIRIAYQSGAVANLEFGTTVIASIAGWSVVATPAADTVYAAFGVDGSSCTEFAWDGVNLQVDINDSDNITQIQRIGAWYKYYITTASGISAVFGGLTWTKINEIYFNAAILNLQLDNTKPTPLFLSGGRIYRSDGVTVIAPTSNSIQIDYDPVYPIGGLLTLPQMEASTILAKEATVKLSVALSA